MALLKTVEEQERMLAEDRALGPEEGEGISGGSGVPMMELLKGQVDFINVITYHAIGYASGRYTLGLADVAAAKFGKRAAMKELQDRMHEYGLTINDVSVPGESLWQLEDSKGNVAFINPDKQIEGMYAKDLGEFYARITGLDVTPDMQSIYDVARFVGSMRPVGKAVRIATKTLPLRPGVLKAVQAGIMGLTTDTLLQVEDVISEKRDNVSFQQALKTGGMFVALGGVVEGVKAGAAAMSDAYFIRSFMKTPMGIAALKEGATAAEMKWYLAAGRAARGGMNHKAWVSRYAKGQRLSKLVWRMDKAAAKTSWRPPAVRLLPEKAGLNTVKPKVTGVSPKSLVRPERRMLGMTLSKEQAEKLAQQTGGAAEGYGKKWQVWKEKPKSTAKPSPKMQELSVEFDKAYIGVDVNKAKDLAEEARLLTAKKIGGPDLLAYASMQDAADALMRKALATKNPYYQMPRARVEEDAAQGVALAKQALARFAPEVPLSKEAISPMTQHQHGKIESMMERHELTPEAFDRLLNYSTGESDVMALTIEQADTLIEHINNLDVSVKDTDAISKVPPVSIDINLPQGSMKRIRRAAGSDEVLNNTMLYSKRLGGAPSNVAIPNLDIRQNMYAKDLENAADVRRRFTRRITAKEARGKEVNAVNVWSSSRYAIGQAEVKSGVPLRRLFSNIVASGVEMTNQNAAAIEAAIKKAGISRIGSPTTFEEGKQIADWLFEEDEVVKQQLWSGMSEDVKALTASYQGLLQDRSARLVRHARFVKWDRAARVAQEKLNQAQITGKKLSKKALEKIMEPVRKAKPINAPAIALTEGRAAKEIGQLEDWLETQTWGTRKAYFMSEMELKELTELYPTGAIPEELQQAETVLGAQPEKILPETMTREGGAKIAKGGSVTAAIAHHMNRVGIFATTHDDLAKFWEAFASTNPSIDDISSIRALINTVLGFHHAASAPVKIVREATKWFWRPYFLSPKRSIWFSARNLHQNVAYGLSQTTLKEVAKSAVDFTTGQLSPWMKEDYNKYWSSRISQRKQMQHQFILQKQGDIISTFGNKAVAIIDLLGSAPIYSDEVNRLLAWPTLHQTAYRNLEKFAKEKMSAKKLWNNLDIDTLHLSQRLELHRLLDEGNVRQFAANWAEYKTENIHFRYETSLRSVAEQTPGGKAWIGLMTFPRGTAEIMYQNGIKPFVQGFNSGNYRQSYKGLKTIMMSIFGSRAARWLLYGLTGRTAYGVFDTIFRYTPVAPGAARVQQMFDDVSGILYMAEEHDRSLPDTADAIMGAVSYQLELFIPFCDVALDHYETTNDVYGVRLYSLLKKKALQQYKDETGKVFRSADRDYHEKIQHMFWGGAERGEEAKRKKGKAPVLKSLFGGGKSLYD